MAIRFDTGSERLARSASVPGTPGTYTWLAWMQIVSLPASYPVFWEMGPNSTGYNQLYIAPPGGAGDFRFGIDGDSAHGGSFDETSDPDRTFGVWYFIAMKRSGTTITLYVGTASAAVTQAWTLAGTGAATPTRMVIGYDDGTSSPNARVQAFRFYDGIALSLEDIQAEQWAQLPRRTSSLWAWWPLLKHSDLVDYSGNGRDLTATGTLSTEDGPPVAWRQGPRRIVKSGPAVFIPPSSYTNAPGRMAITQRA